MSIPGELLSEIITWVRRIIKFPSQQSISDDTIIDYINRFYLYDIPTSVQLFELKRQYSFEALEGIYEYAFPYREYQLIRQPVFCDGEQIGYFNHTDEFYQVFPQLIQNEKPFQGDGGVSYSFTATTIPILRGFTDHLDNLLPRVFITAIASDGLTKYIVDNGNGVLNQTDDTFQNILVANAGTVDYSTGAMVFNFSVAIPSGNDINIQTQPFSTGRPRSLLFFNNTISLYPVPDRTYLIQLDAQITPAAFLESANEGQTFEFGYMAEYIARGSARKIMADNGDDENLRMNETFFKEQEHKVLRRTNRQQQVTRKPTIFSGQTNSQSYQYNQY